MIMQLQPDQISAFWDAIKHGMVQLERLRGRGLKVQDHLNHILNNLLSGYLQCWIIYTEVDGEKKLHAFGMSYVMQDKLTGEDRLIIDSLYGFRKLNDELAMESLEGLKKYAKGIGCAKIYAITNNKRVIELMQLSQFEPAYKIYSLEV